MDMRVKVIVHAYVVMLRLGNLEEVYNFRLSSTGTLTLQDHPTYTMV